MERVILASFCTKVVQINESKAFVYTRSEEGSVYMENATVYFMWYINDLEDIIICN